MSNFPEKLWALSFAEQDILTYLYFSETENHAIYLLLDDIDNEVYIDKSMIVSEDYSPNKHIEEAYWADYSMFLKYRNNLLDRLVEIYKDKIKKLESSKIYE